MNLIDTYKTIRGPVEGDVFKDKGSKFIGYAYSVSNEAQIKNHIETLKESHYKARHWCYAWRLGVKKNTFRVNDDGEPNNSAGNPIYRQILSNELTNVLVVVVRYFGGTKLGVGGLINAYRSAASLVLEASQVVQRTIDVIFELKFEYADMNKVMRLVKERKIKVVNQEMNIQCEFKISVRLNEAENTKSAFENLRCVRIKESN